MLKKKKIRLLLTHRLSDIFLRLKSSPLFRDSFWAVLGNIIEKGLSLISGVIVARLLTKEIYGEYGVLKDSLLMIGTFSSFGLAYTATKFIAEKHTKENTDLPGVYAIHITSTIITVIASAIVGVLSFIYSDLIADLINISHLADFIKYLSVAIVFNALNAMQIGELSGFGAYKKMSINNALIGIVTFVTTIPLTYYKGLQGAILALLIANIARFIVNRFTLKDYIPLFFRLDKRTILSTFVDISSFSLPIALQETLYSLSHWTMMLIMIKMSDFGEIGIMTAANQWAFVLLFVPGTLKNVSLAYLSKTNNDLGENRGILKTLLAVNFAMTFIPFIIFVVLSRWICSLYGDSYDGLQMVYVAVLGAAVVNSLANVLSSELMAYKQNWYLFAYRLLRDVLMLLGLYILLRYRLVSGALSMALVNLIMGLGYFSLLYIKTLKIHRYDKHRFLYRS